MKTTRRSVFRLFACLAGLAPLIASAELRLPPVFADDMVLQRDRANPIWGWDKPGAKVVVSIDAHSVTATAQANGRWQVQLPRLPARSEPLEIRIRSSAGSERFVRNVLVGEVWLFIGPSNIYWPVQRSNNADQEISSADYPQIRFFTVAKGLADKPQPECKGTWAVCSPKTVGPMSGIAYFFSRRIHQETKVPIGVLQSYWGGSRVEAWTSLPALQSESELRPILGSWDGLLAKKYDPATAAAKHAAELRTWRQNAATAKSAGRDAPRRPRKPADPAKSKDRPAALFNAMVAPLVPYGIRGIATYQGLGNLYWAEYSVPLLRAMTRDWRSLWQQERLPIGMVQPAPFPCGNWPKLRADAYSLQREAQLLIHDELSHIGIAATTDIGDLEELHFTNKQEVGRRLAQWALAEVYGQPKAYSLPRFRALKTEGNRIRIHLHDTGGQLMTIDGKAPTHFQIAGKNGRFKTASAIIDGETIVLSHPEVPGPTHARFGWSETAIPNLVNALGQPVSLFRTDDLRPD